MPPHWGEHSKAADLWDLKGLLSSLIPGARLQGVTLQDRTPEGGKLEPDNGFTVVGFTGEALGQGGRVRADAVDAPAWAGPVWALEITLPSVPNQRTVPVFKPLPAFPGVDRDLSLLLPKALQARQVERLIRGNAGPFLVDLTIFDLYEGEGVPDGYRSVAFRLRFQSGERTLKDEDVEQAVTAVTARLREEFGVETRG
jgi:phenylalanyl-tRNA synthetase beta chain